MGEIVKLVISTNCTGQETETVSARLISENCVIYYHDGIVLAEVIKTTDGLYEVDPEGMLVESPLDVGNVVYGLAEMSALDFLRIYADHMKGRRVRCASIKR